MNNFLFQYCQKIVVFSQDRQKVLLCKRKGEKDFDGTFSFIGGKMETTDRTLLNGLSREKNEEVGEKCKINIFTKFSYNTFFTKSDGNSMILPHYFAIFKGGNIILSNEYSEYTWVSIEELNEFEPKIPNIPEVVKELLKLIKIADSSDFLEI